MFGLSVKSEFNAKPVLEATDRAALKNIGHAAARISKDAKASIITSDDPSAPGEPPHTRGKGGHNLRGAIRFAATKEEAVIGPMFSIVGTVGEAHEFGRDFHGESFEERPFMGPALMQNIPMFADSWRGSIGE